MIGEVSRVPKLKTINGDSIYGIGNLDVGASALYRTCTLQPFSENNLIQTIDNIDGVVADSTVIIDVIVDNPEEMSDVYSSWSHVYKAESGNGSITFYADGKTSDSIDLQLVIL